MHWPQAMQRKSIFCNSYFPLVFPDGSFCTKDVENGYRKFRIDGKDGKGRFAKPTKPLP